MLLLTTSHRTLTLKWHFSNWKKESNKNTWRIGKWNLGQRKCPFSHDHKIKWKQLKFNPNLQVRLTVQLLSDNRIQLKGFAPYKFVHSIQFVQILLLTRNENGFCYTCRTARIQFELEWSYWPHFIIISYIVTTIIHI